MQHHAFALVTEVGLQIQRGVILAADSRWTRPGARRDSAVKLFPVGSGGLAAYAGTVVAGEDAIHELSVRLSARRASTLDEMNAVARQSLQTVWARYAVPGGSLHLLLGVSERSGGCWLGRFSDEDDFCAHAVTDMELIGPEPAKEHFRRVFGQIVEQQLAGHSHSALVGSWAGTVARALYDTCEKQAHAFVGGNVQYASTSAGKANLHTFYRLWPGRMDLGAQELTVDPLKAHTLTKWWKHRPPAADP